MRLPACLAIVVAASITVAGQDLPAGPGQDLLKSRCLSCHQVDLVEQQQLTKAGWEREIDKMVRWGAKVDASERELLSGYLSTHFGTAPMPAHTTAWSDAPAAPESPGDAVFRRSCLSCHGRDLVEQQRLTQSGWLREVDKMIRWGAPVAAADKDALVTFLATRHGAPAGSR